MAMEAQADWHSRLKGLSPVDVEMQQLSRRFGSQMTLVNDHEFELLFRPSERDCPFSVGEGGMRIFVSKPSA